MRTPIQYALTYPERAQGISRKMDWANPFTMHFEPPDEKKFPAIKLAYNVAQLGGTAGAVLNAANESAVAAFMSGNICFGRIAEVVAATLQAHQLQRAPSLDDLLDADRWARRTADKFMQSESRSTTFVSQS
jgi:1-deoxy-D-xylulose-5-phosphate reductoisomerase